MDISYTINQSQRLLEDKLRSQQLLSYENVIIPITKEILDTLKNTPPANWPRHSNIASDIDIYIEALSIYVIYNYAKNIAIEYTPHVMMLVLLKHPYFINVFMIGKNYEEWTDLASKITNEFVLTFGKNVTYDHKYQLKDLLNEATSFGSSALNKTISERSGLSQYNYILGFHYSDKTQGILKDDVISYTSQLFESKKITNYIYIVVNTSFNIKNTNSIVIYKQLPKYPERIIDVKRIQNSKVFVNPDKIFKADKPVDILDRNFNLINNVDDSIDYAIVLLSYNDAKDVDRNHYIIAEYGDNVYLTKSEMKDFLNRRVMRFLDAKLLELELIESFYKYCRSRNDDLTVLKRQYIQLSTYAKHIFETSTKEEFIDNFIKNISSVQIINPAEVQYLKLYLHGIHLLKIYSQDSVIRFVTSYIYPDLLTTNVI